MDGGSIAGSVFIVFLILKLVGVIHWSWWWVTSPLWIDAAATALVIVIVILVGGSISAAFSLGSRRRRKKIDERLARHRANRYRF